MEYRGNGINPIVIVTKVGVSKVGTPTFVLGFLLRDNGERVESFYPQGHDNASLFLRSSFGDPSAKVQSGNGVVSEW